MATTQPDRRGTSRVRNVHKSAAPRNRSEEILTRGASAWDSPNQKLNPNTSYYRTLHKRERGLRWYTTGTFWLAVPLVIGAAFMYVQAKVEPPLDLATVSVPANASDGKETAFAELRSWLAEEYSPLPGAEIVSWDGYTFQDAPTPEKSTDEKLPYRFETHQFTLVRMGAAYQVTVQVAVSDSVGAVATSNPSYVPIPMPKSFPGGTPVSWFNLESVSAPESVKPAITDWAEAYTSGDADALRRAVGDPTAANVYVPLSGVDELVEVTVVDAAYLPDPDASKDADLAEKNAGMVVRVEVSMWWDGQNRGDENSDPRPTSVSYDVLVQDPGTASPKVVAWGAAGSGPTLDAYQNAITDITEDQLVQPKSDPSQGPDDETGSSPTPSPSPTSTEESH